MGWASGYIERLKQGETVTFRPRGGSMTGRIESGQRCTVEPVADAASLRIDDIVLCRVHGAEYLHLITAIDGMRFQIGNNKGYVNGWIGPNGIFGRCVKIEP
ncbi:MAG: hypothetical protein ACTHOH_03670 [Lysobacteraceae bacterium]